MNWISNYWLRRSQKDIVLVETWNESAIKTLKRIGYVRSLGISDKGRSKGKEGVLITQEGEQYLSDISQKRRESLKYWFMVFITLFAGAIGFILGRIFD